MLLRYMNRISLVTICFNNLDELIKTCASVDSQDMHPFEHIIIDGSSKEDIKNYLNSSPQPPYRRWLCERDKGISDAFNKGIALCTGDIINLLNSGDTLYDSQALGKVQKAFEANPDVQWVHGKLYTLRGGIWVAIGKPFDKALLYKGMRGTMHPTMFLRKELYEKHGTFDISLKMAMDYDLLCRIADEKSFFIDAPLTTFDPEGVSTANYVKAMQESYAQYRKYFGYSAKQQAWEYRQRFMHWLLHTPVGKWLYKVKVNAGKENA